MSSCSICKDTFIGGQDNIFLLQNETVLFCNDCIHLLALKKCDVCCKPLSNSDCVVIDHDHYCRECSEDS